MTSDEILQQVNALMRTVFDNDTIQVTHKTVAKDVPEWDSLTHVELVVAIERHFKFKFTAKELNSFKNVGEMCANIERRIAA
jgi:acyl carrier protein